jgi:hypothetical protein
VGDEAIPGSAKAFIADHVDSVLLLEILLLLHARRDRAWSPQQVSVELRMESGWAQEQLRHLCAREVLVCKDAPEPTYQFAPKDPAVAAAVDDLARAYADRRVAVISLIYSRPTEKIRSFADAFRLRGKDKPNG